MPTKWASSASTNRVSWSSIVRHRMNSAYEGLHKGSPKTVPPPAGSSKGSAHHHARCTPKNQLLLG